jgi:hypothetical protein
MRHVWIERRSETLLPTRDEFYTVAPATVKTKARYGIARFDAQWNTSRLSLFEEEEDVT